MARNDLAQVVLREQVNGKVVFQNSDILVLAHTLDERSFDLGTRKVLIVEDAVLGVATLAVKVEITILGLAMDMGYLLYDIVL